MKNSLFFVISFVSVLLINGQERTFKCDDIHKAAKLIDSKKYDEAIQVLEQCRKVDPTDYAYPYEIGLALYYKEDYAKSVAILEEAKKMKDVKEDLYQLLGNTYDVMGNSAKAIETYDEGLKFFPNAGRLYLEKGVVYELDKKYSEAVKLYLTGIKKDPYFPSNYYRLALLYLQNEKFKLEGIFYGETYLNLERNSPRSYEMSRLLYKIYAENIDLTKGKMTVHFCKEATINVEDLKKSKVPFCMVYEVTLLPGLVTTNGDFSLQNLVKIRTEWMKKFIEKDFAKYPSDLLSYQKKLYDLGIYEAYNYYLFQVGSIDKFSQWKLDHKSEYEKFADWYSKNENKINLTPASIILPQ